MNPGLVQLLVLDPIYRSGQRRATHAQVRAATLRDGQFEGRIVGVELEDDIARVTYAHLGVVLGTVNYPIGSDGLRDVTHAAGLGIEDIAADQLVAGLIGRRVALVSQRNTVATQQAAPPRTAAP